MKTYSTSEIARMMGIHPNTVMLYEKWGYIAPVPRKENGYRVYTETHLEHMKLIRLALRSEAIKWYMRFEVKNIIRSAAQGDFEKALELSKEHLTNIQNEKKNEIKMLRVIKALRQENYSTQCIGNMLKKLKTKSMGNHVFLFEEIEDSNEGLLSSLSQVESNTKELISYIGELISKKAEI